MITWHLVALILLLAAIVCHLCAAFGVSARVSWPELGWAFFTGAAFALIA